MELLYFMRQIRKTFDSISFAETSLTASRTPTNLFYEPELVRVKQVFGTKVPQMKATSIQSCICYMIHISCKNIIGVRT